LVSSKVLADILPSSEDAEIVMLSCPQGLRFPERNKTQFMALPDPAHRAGLAKALPVIDPGEPYGERVPQRRRGRSRLLSRWFSRVAGAGSPPSPFRIATLSKTRHRKIVEESGKESQLQKGCKRGAIPRRGSFVSVLARLTFHAVMAKKTEIRREGALSQG